MNPEPIMQLYSKLGDDDADRFICEVLEDLALHLARIGRAHAADDQVLLVNCANRLVDGAHRLGLGRLAHVAGDVSGCARGDDAAALAATLARLSRVGDASMTAIWDPVGQSC